MDRKQREVARSKKNYYKKKEEAARTKAHVEFLKREDPALLEKFEEEYSKGRAEESVTRTNPPATPNVISRMRLSGWRTIRSGWTISRILARISRN
jgi:hypothetical protein